MAYSIKIAQVSVKCYICESDSNIKWKCMDCSILMCNNCREKVHSKFKNAQEHKTIDIKDIRVHGDKIDFTNIKCIQHSSQYCCLFCKTCDCLVCPTCFTKGHKRHDLTEISIEYDMKIQSLKERQGKIQRSNAKTAIQIGQLQNLVNKENRKHLQVRKDITDHKIVIKDQVEKYFDKLSIKLDQSHENAISSLNSDLDVVSLFYTQTKEITNEVQEFILTTDASKFFREVNELEQSLDIPIQQIKSSYISSQKFDPGNIPHTNVGSLEDDENLSIEPHISLVINKEYQTKLPAITFIRPCLDNSYWICDTIGSMLQMLKPDGTKLNKIFQYEIDVYCLAILPSNDVLLATKGDKRLQQLTITTGKLTETVYNVAPLVSTAIHIASGNKVLVGGYNAKQDRSAVFVMNERGEHEAVYEYNIRNRPIFTYPRSLESTRNGDIFVGDSYAGSISGKVVVLEQGGDIINEYTGHPDINKDHPFQPVNIVVTPTDNVVVQDQNNPCLYILSNKGYLFTYFRTNNIGILYPYSLAFNTAGQLCIGCSRNKGSTSKEAKLYEVNISGF